jgi:hypothetical protein
MRRIALLASLALAAACAPTRAGLTVNWTFGGKSCADAGVAIIQFAIQGEVLTPDNYTCAQAPQGADLGRYLLGSYQLTVYGLDAHNIVLYQSTVPVQVQRGGTVIAIDVVLVPGAPGSATLRWTFDGRSCAASGVTVINASLDNQVLTDERNNGDLPCSENGVDGVQVAPLTAGQHSFYLVGKVGGTIKYALNGVTVNVSAGQDTAVQVNLLPAAPTLASANLTWAFDGKSCTVANVDHVQIFFDPKPDGSGGIDSGTVACHNGSVDGAAVDGVPEGTHSFAITGIRAGHIVYFTHHPPSTMFRIGLISDLFVPAESP